MSTVAAGKRYTVKAENVARVARVYSDALAVIDAPIYRAAPERLRSFQDGYTAAVRDVMRALLGAHRWETARHELDGRDFGELLDAARALEWGRDSFMRML